MAHFDLDQSADLCAQILLQNELFDDQQYLSVTEIAAKLKWSDENKWHILRAFALFYFRGAIRDVSPTTD
jgi:hypothetical protein